LRGGGAAGAPCLLLSRQILLGDTLDDLPALVHAVQQLRLKVDESLAQVRQLAYRAELFGSIREKIRIVDD